MSSGRPTSYDYKPLGMTGRRSEPESGFSTLVPPRAPESDVVEGKRSEAIPQGESAGSTIVEPKKARKKMVPSKERPLLASDPWLVRNGHSATYAALYLFTAMVFFRPYELMPGMGFLASTTIYFGIVMVLLFVPSQLVTEGNLTAMTTEVKALLVMTAVSLLTMPISRNPVMAWETFSDTFIKAVVVFIVLVNVVRTRKRLMGLIWLSLGIGIYLAGETTRLYMAGQFSIEGYRVAVSNVKGIFGNPNEMALHFVMMIPIAITLGVASRKNLAKFAYFAIGGLFVIATMFTFSRGAFLGLITAFGVLAWKLGRKQRLNVTVAAVVAGTGFMLAAPGNYGLRLLSIFIPSLDPVGSAGARREGLITSLIVTIRNPWGVGIGNSPEFGAHNLQTHNAFTQVSTELGILGLIAYLVFIVSPFRKLGAIERTLFNNDDRKNWFYYMSIGLQASIAGYMVTSFFASVAYNWFIYYVIAYAVALRRVYSIENELIEVIRPKAIWDRQAAASA